MSSRRLVLRFGAVGGGSALIGWAVSEWLGVRNGLVSGLFGEALTCGLIGGAMGAGMNLVANRSGASRSEMARRSLAGLASGFFAGAIGVSLGHALLGRLYGSRAVGWAIMGGGVGAGQGLYERSPTKLRQGVIAAAVGGLAGGLPFGAVYSLCSRLSEPGSRAAAFVLFGVCVGASIGLARALFANAAKTSRPAVASVPKRQPTVMTPCPKCKRPVPGSRPYCVVCKLSF